MTDPVKKILEDAQKVADETVDGVAAATDQAKDRLRKLVGESLIDEMTRETVNVPELIDSVIEAALLVGMATAPTRKIGRAFLLDCLQNNEELVSQTASDPEANFWCSIN